MRVAALYDIHGNLPALEAVLAEARSVRVDRILIGGDVVPGPMPRDTLSCLMAIDLPVDFIRGNGESDVLASVAGIESVRLPAPVRDAIRWSGEQLAPEQCQSVGAWPLTHRLDVDGLGPVLFCHGTPLSDSDIFTRRTPSKRLIPVFGRVPERTVVCGHTHMQFDRQVGATRVVNAGSIGMPFGKPGAYWALLGPQVELRRTDYDLSAAAARVRATGYPGAEEFAERNVIHPPTEAQMLDVLERASLGAHEAGGA